MTKFDHWIVLNFRCLQEVHLDKHIKLLDCPGIVMATSTSDAAMILRNCVKIEQLVDPLPPVEAILRRCNKTQVCCVGSLPISILKMYHRKCIYLSCTEYADHGALWHCRFSFSSGVLGTASQTARQTKERWTAWHWQSSEECTDGLDGVGLKRYIHINILVINVLISHCIFFKFLFRGRISYFTHPPEVHTLPTHVSAEIVTEMGKAFDWDELEKGNQDVLAGKRNLHLKLWPDPWTCFSVSNLIVLQKN